LGGKGVRPLLGERVIRPLECGKKSQQFRKTWPEKNLCVPEGKDDNLIRNAHVKLLVPRKKKGRFLGEAWIRREKELVEKSKKADNKKTVGGRLQKVREKRTAVKPRTSSVPKENTKTLI